MVEEAAVKAGIGFGERLAAELARVELQNLGQERDAGEVDAAAAGLPQGHAFGGDREGLGDVGLAQMQMLAAAADPKMEERSTFS